MGYPDESSPVNHFERQCAEVAESPSERVHLFGLIWPAWERRSRPFWNPRFFYL
jgi:hypothetical protein